jgi:hypothetical protein
MDARKDLSIETVYRLGSDAVSRSQEFVGEMVIER